MIDLTSIITIAIAIAVVYFFIRFIVNPIVKIITGIIVFLVALYVLQRFFNIDVYNMLGPWGKYLDISKIGTDWLSNFINYCVKQITEVFKGVLQTK